MTGTSAFGARRIAGVAMFRNQQLDLATEELGARIAEKPLGFPVDQADGSRTVDHDQSGGERLDNGLEALLQVLSLIHI